MKDILDIKDIEKTEKLENEYDLQKASLLERKLRLMINENPDLKPIRKKLKEFDLTQQDLGVILEHPKSYMSELMNGVSQFTLKDLVIIHRILGINLNTLIPTYYYRKSYLQT